MVPGTEWKEQVLSPGADEAMQALLAGASFRKAPTLRRLLQYLWEHRDAELSEYAIATDVLQRKSDFDPKIDSVVRVHILRLRQKLKDHYEAEGHAEAIRFTIPTGSLSVRAVMQEVPVAPEMPVPASVAAEETEPARRTWSFAVWAALAVLVIVLAGAVGYKTGARGIAEPGSGLPQFWKRAILNGKPTQLVVPSPVFLQWPNSLRVRDVRYNDFGEARRSSEIQKLVASWGEPTLSQSYTVLASSLAAASLGQYLGLKGVAVATAGENQLSLDNFENHNLVFLGFPHTSRWLKELLDASDFHMDPGGLEIANRRPQPGEAARFLKQEQSPTHKIEPQLLALLPGKSKGTNVLLLGGVSAALGAYLTSPAGVEALDSAWATNGRPAYFEAIILAETEGTALVRARLAAYHPRVVSH